MERKMERIFEIIKHSDHELKTIKFDGHFHLGCKYCGDVLLSTDKEIVDNDIEIETILDNISKECNLYTAIIDFLKKVIELDDKEIREIAVDILDKIEDGFNDIKETDPTFLEHRTVKINVLDEIIEKMYLLMEDKYLDEFEIIHPATRPVFYITDLVKKPEFKDLITDYIERIIVEIKSRNKEEYIILKNNESCVISYCEITNDSYEHIKIINKELLKEEENNPTLKDEVKIETLKDYYDLLPSEYEEETRSYKYRKYAYIIENDLLKVDKDIEKELMYEIISILKMNLKRIYREENHLPIDRYIKSLEIVESL